MSRAERTLQALGVAAVATPIEKRSAVSMSLSPGVGDEPSGPSPFPRFHVHRLTYGVITVQTCTGPTLALISFARKTPPPVTVWLITASPAEVSAVARVSPVGSISTILTRPLLAS